MYLKAKILFLILIFMQIAMQVQMLIWVTEILGIEWIK